MCFSSPGDIRPFSSMHLRRRQGRTSWVIAHTGSGQQSAAEPGSVPPMTAICPGARHRMAGGLAACSGETTLTEHSGSARAGGRGLSGKGRKSQRSSNPASQRYRVVGFHDIHSSGFAVSAPVARAVTDIRSQCVRWAGDRGLPPAKSNNSHGCDSSVSTRARGSGRKDLGYRTQRSQVQVLPHARRV